jgi:signal transduction histidine kinase
MPNTELAAWLQDHKELLASSLEGERALNLALIDQVLEVTRTDRVDGLDAAIGQAARQAAMQVLSLDQVLSNPARLKEAIWGQLRQGELDPIRILAFIDALEPIFSRLIKIATLAYWEANQQIQDALASEIARLHSEAERRVRDRTADLTRANIELGKLEKARTDFISIAAHELKTPLNLIQGYTNMLREMSAVDGDLTGSDHLVQGILRGTERLSAIVEDLLDVSVIDTNALSLRVEEVSLSQVFDVVVTRNERYARERQLTIHTGDLTGLPVIEFDRRRLHQTLDHLLNNAIKYTPDGGQIFIEGRVLGDKQLVGKVHAGDHEFVEITIRDTGIGVAPEDRERIFEKFYRVGKSTLHSTSKVKFKGAGPGLGLPIARGLVEAHGGRLWVESPGHDEVNCPGSTFHMLLPVRAMPKPDITVTWVETSLLRADEPESE